jgi:Tfp pilus assembly protein PilF
MATSASKKIASVLLGVILSLVLLEAGLRLSGFILSSIQEYGNLRSIKQKGVYRILCLGESTTERQYPQFLEQVLNQRNIGVRFSVIDKGKSNTNTVFILNRVESYLAKYHPDMVVAMMGCNDKGVKYYEDIRKSDTWLFRHCRVYRFCRIIIMHISKKIKHEGIYGLSRSYPGGKAKPEDTGTVPRETNPLKETFAATVTPLNGKDVEGTSGPRNSYLNDRKLSSVEGILGKDVELNLKNDKDYVELGWLFLRQGKLSYAEYSFKKAIELNPKDDRIYAQLGFLYIAEGEIFLAEDAFKKAIELNPKNDRTYAGLGESFLKQGKLSQAESSFKKAIELNPKNDHAYAGLGTVFQGQFNKLSQAESSFKKAIELNPKNDHAYVGLGTVFQSQFNKLSQAEDSYRKAFEINPRNELAALFLADLYRRRDLSSQAEDILKKALMCDPKNERVLGAMASLYEKMGKSKLAQEFAAKERRLRLENTAALTVKNYRRLKAILDRKGIKLVCVQYPVCNVEPLKRIFEKDGGVIFVDNERVFKKVLKKGSYKEYFIDMFGGDFGHCTPKGNMLLAQNIADVILREVFNKR